MHSFVKKSISLFLAVVTAFFVCSPVLSAADYQSTATSLWEYYLHSAVDATKDWGPLGWIEKQFAFAASDSVCSLSDDNFHHADSIKGCKTGSDKNGYYALPTCKYCGEKFKYYASDLEKQYTKHVKSLPARGYGSDGGLYVSPNHLYTQVSFRDGSNYTAYYCSHYKESVLPSSLGSLACGSPTIRYRAPTSDGKVINYLKAVFQFTCSVDGVYSFVSSYRASVNGLSYSGSTVTGKVSIYNTLTYNNLGFDKVRYAGDLLNFEVTGNSMSDSLVSATLNAPEPQLKVTPLESMSNDYPQTSRPGSFVGNFTYNVDNTTNKVENTTIVNETTNTVYNPVTNTTTNITNWTYDYSDRSYTVTTDNSTTQTITYGDEYVTIKEGDTIYNIYYYVAQDQNPDQDTGCKHSYTSTVTTAATCEAPGLMTYTCSKCGDTYTEKIPATGHTWQVKQTVKTEYDEAGNVTQQGYTVYKCAICGTEYKDDAGTGPPSTPDNGDSGSGGIWDKLGNLLSSVVAGILSLIEAVFGKLLDSMISLAEMIAGKLKQVVELVLSFFDEIPAMFGGFLGFLSAVFPFIPDDIMLLLTFGIAAVVFIGIIKALRR